MDNSNLPNDNLSKWRYYLKDIPSPNSYINMAFYSMIASSLQRRVWFGSSTGVFQIFPNMYIVLVGEPGLGKTLVIKPVNEMIRHWKLPDEYSQLREQHIKNLKQYESEGTVVANAPPLKNKDDDERYILPVAADSTTYAALTQEMARSVRRIDFKEPSEMAPLGIYTHSSLCSLLEELSSLFRKHAEDIVDFLLVAYDCGDYKKSTKHNGVDRIRKCCLNMLAGTTPSFMQNSFDERLLSEGYASRSLFVFEHANRFNKFEIEDYNEEQLKARQDILNHVKVLSELHGQVMLSDDAKAFLKEYFEKVLPQRRDNYNLKLNPYYARKKVHTIKLAMSIHFADKTDMVITLDECKIALGLLASLEKKMHFALQYKGNNPLGAVSKKVVRYITASGPKTFKELWKELEMEAREQELQEVLRFLIATSSVKDMPGDDGKSIIYEITNRGTGEE